MRTSSHYLEQLRGHRWELLRAGGFIDIKLTAKEHEVNELRTGSKTTENNGRRELNCAHR